MNKLRGRNAIITGASRGIGQHIARALATEGCNLALAARTVEPIELLIGELAPMGVRCVPIKADVGTAAGRETLLARATQELGPIDVLVNNAALEVNRDYCGFSPADIEEMIQVDLIAPMLLTRATLPSMLERRTGHVINIASLAGKSATPYNTPYSAAKGGLILFTHSLRAELRGTGVSCSVVVPGFISETGMFANKNVDVPVLVGASPPEKVARAVVRSLKKDTLETIVAPGPLRLLQAFNQMYPETFTWIITRVGAMEPFKKIASSTRGS